MFERFTESAREVIVRGREAALELRHNRIGTEHLLIGLVRVEGPHRGILLNVGLSEATVVPAVSARAAAGTGDPPRELPFSPEAKQAMERALREALEQGHQHIGPEQLAVALVKGRGLGGDIVAELVPDAPALGRSLSDFGVGMARMGEAVRRARESDGGSG